MTKKCALNVAITQDWQRTSAGRACGTLLSGNESPQRPCNLGFTDPWHAVPLPRVLACRTYNTLVQITHPPLGWISEPNLSKTRRAHTRKMVALGRPRWDLSINASLGVCTLPVRCRENQLRNSSGCMCYLLAGLYGTTPDDTMPASERTHSSCLLSNQYPEPGSFVAVNVAFAPMPPQADWRYSHVSSFPWNLVSQWPQKQATKKRLG